MARIFLSYSHNDKDFVDRIEPRIHNIFGLSSLWYDRSRGGLKGGMNWWPSILREIEIARVFILLVSEHSLKSESCVKELKHAITMNLKVIPVLLASYTKKYPSGFPTDIDSIMKEIQYVDLRDGHDDLSLLWGAILAEMESLTRTERWLLHNQYEIMRRIVQQNNDKSEVNDLEKIIKVLIDGYESHYHHINGFLTRPMRESDGDLVLDILDMYRTIADFRENNDYSSLSDLYLHFSGFDGNHETKNYSYAHFLIYDMGFYQESKPERDEGNSHWPMLPIYKLMLREWHKSIDRYRLTKEDVIRIINAADNYTMELE